MTEAKTFPIQAGHGKPRVKGFRIPWIMAEVAYKTYGKGDQSLARLAERGGFGWSEFCLLYCGLSPYGGDVDRNILIACTQVVVEELVSQRDDFEEEAEKLIEAQDKIAELEGNQESITAAFQHERSERIRLEGELARARDRNPAEELEHLKLRVKTLSDELRDLALGHKGNLGDPGVRDPDNPCTEYKPGARHPLADCEADGHYLCTGCSNRIPGGDHYLPEEDVPPGEDRLSDLPLKNCPKCSAVLELLVDSVDVEAGTMTCVRGGECPECGGQFLCCESCGAWEGVDGIDHHSWCTTSRINAFHDKRDQETTININEPVDPDNAIKVCEEVPTILAKQGRLPTRKEIPIALKHPVDKIKLNIQLADDKQGDGNADDDV